MAAKTGGCSVIILDEIGLLELKGDGWADLFNEQLRSGKFVVIAVRSSLVEQIQRHFRFTAAHIWFVQKDSPDAAAQVVLAQAKSDSE